MSIKKIIFAILAACFIGLFAQIEIKLPLNKEAIDISGQTFAILLAAFFLGRWYGLLAVVIYIAMGAFGLPVFSGGASGYENLYNTAEGGLSGSSGYFGGFLYAAYMIGNLGDQGWRKTFKNCLLATLYGTLCILIFGVLRLTFKYGFMEALEVGFYPFIIGGIIKILLGAICAYYLEKMISKKEKNL